MKNALMIVLALALGCKASGPAPAGEKAEGADAPPSSTAQAPEAAATALVTPQELEELRATFAAELAALPASCPREVLRGQATPGSGEAALLEAVTIMQAAPCDDAFSGDDPPTDEVVNACMPAIAAARRAVAHEDLCSPWRPGLRGTPGLRPMLHLGKLIARVARQQLSADQPADAVSLLLDGVRLSQDLSRGRTSLIVAMVGAAITKSLVEPLTQAVAAAPPDVARRALAEVEALQETEPTYHGVLQGEILTTQLMNIVPALEGPGWTPPGGWGDQPPPTFDDPDDTQTLTGDIRVDMALTWLAYREIADGVLAACPASADLAACASGLSDQYEAQRRATAPQTGVEATVRLLLAENPAREVRAEVIRLLRGVLTVDFGRYALEHDLRREVLAKLHTELEAKLSGPAQPAP